ncbi:MAG: hypothetical protein VYC17_03940, partial [Nitrospinota bacterium]|nr:hypothetical protein [Nitrospinota bacterium]
MKWLVAKIFALESRDDTSAVAVIAAISGFLVGIAYSTWHVVLESAQIIAGIVEHSLELPNYLFLLKAWNLLNQGAAIFLKAGLLEKPICIVISGLLGMVSFLALSLATYAMCKNAFVAVGMPFFIQFTHAAQFGIQYPLVILGIWSSYGAFSFGFNLLVISLISLKKYRAGGFLLGIAPGIHVVTGGFLWIVSLVVLFWDFKNHWELFKKTVKSFLAGVTFSAISFLTHTALFGFIWGQGGGDAEILGAYLRHWDFHRAPVNLLSVNFIIGIYSLAVCLMGVFFFKRNQGVSGDSLFQLQALSIFGILGLLASLISHLPHEL